MWATQKQVPATQQNKCVAKQSAGQIMRFAPRIVVSFVVSEGFTWIPLLPPHVKGFGGQRCRLIVRPRRPPAIA